MVVLCGVLLLQVFLVFGCVGGATREQPGGKAVVFGAWDVGGEEGWGERRRPSGECNGDVNDPVEAVANEAKTARKHVTNPPQGPQKSH